MENNNYVWKSTEKSRLEQKISVLAIFESILFVGITWLVAWKFDSYIHIYIAIGLAPLLLLKTETSMKNGIKLFINKKSFDRSIMYKSKLFWFVLVLGMLSMGLTSMMFSIVIFKDLNGYELFVTSVFFYIIVGMLLGCLTVNFSYLRDRNIIGALYAVSIVSCSMIMIESDIFQYMMGMLVGIFLSFIIAMLIGLLIRSIWVKSYVTLIQLLLHPIECIKQIPNNFREQIMVNDIFYSPEFIPGISKEQKAFQASGILQKAKHKSIGYKFLSYLIFLFILPAYLYRWSIKSTAWFYFPLIYLVNLKEIANKIKLENKLSDQMWIVNKKFNILILICFVMSWGMPVDINEKSFPLASLYILKNILASNLAIYKNMIDPDSLLLVLTSTILYFIILVFVSYRDHKKKDKLNYNFPKTNLIVHWIIRLKFVMWYIFFMWNLIIIWNNNIWSEIIAFIR